jgi:hypothetical protein
MVTLCMQGLVTLMLAEPRFKSSMCFSQLLCLSLLCFARVVLVVSSTSDGQDQNNVWVGVNNRGLVVDELIDEKEVHSDSLNLCS